MSRLTDFRDEMHEFSRENVSESVGIKLLAIIRERMQERVLLRDFVKHIGKLKIECSDDLFSGGDRMVREIVESFVIYLNKTYAALREEFGEDADQVFIDLMPKIIFKYN